ncbi:MAG: DNA mismatch repair protein MutS [Candidatus Aureabacteria bacterium]|nr:DNA mismatch repair protein MutS [Candidatus Auribacterota bacterium]
MTDSTPMMKQYRRIKAAVKDAVLLFRLGDFYEMFFEDAQKASRILGITLTARQSAPMCGIPYHAASGYISRLLQAGCKVAVCEQMEDPKLAKGIVRRELIRIITPGTAVEEELLPASRNNYLAAVSRAGAVFGLAFLDLSTGEFTAAELPSPEELVNELLRIRPSECLVSSSWHARDRGALFARVEAEGIVFTPLEDWLFDYDSAAAALKKQLAAVSLDGFGLRGMIPAVSAAGAVIQYAWDNLRSPLGHVRALSVYQPGDFMIMDAASQRNLEMLEPLRSSDRSATLLGVLDRSLTPLGSRALRQWLLRPLRQPEEINRRLDRVQALVEDRSRLSGLREALKGIRDLERIVGRAACGSTQARELAGLRDSLRRIPGLRSCLEEGGGGVWTETVERLDPCSDLCALLARALAEAPPLSLKEGGMIRPGYSAELDALRSLAHDGKAWIGRYQEEEIARTGIKSLKARFNKVFGYYLEVTKSNLPLVPADYRRKQTLVNAERFTTEPLSDYEKKVLGAEEKAAALEYELFEDLRRRVGAEASRIQGTAAAVAVLDALASLAETAVRNGYVRPRVDDSREIEIRNGRHPVVETLLAEERFVGNDTLLDGAANQILIITGPNMAGKSTYIRQVALIVLMAQIGSFVPADSARIGTADRIFTRVGASDDLARGQSTFMVEMLETANILHHATERSLVVLDEIGRGTSTFDGISIAWAVAEYLHNHPGRKARTLFATHYHELTELELTLPGVKNYNVAVREWNDRVVFLRTVARGGTDKSYGIQVARLAGLPQPVIDRARVILDELEAETLAEDGLPRFARPRPAGSQQLLLFSAGSHPLLAEIKNLNLEHMTPFEAMQRLKELKERAGE